MRKIILGQYSDGYMFVDLDLESYNNLKSEILANPDKAGYSKKNLQDMADASIGLEKSELENAKSRATK